MVAKKASAYGVQVWKWCMELGWQIAVLDNGCGVFPGSQGCIEVVWGADLTFNADRCSSAFATRSLESLDVGRFRDLCQAMLAEVKEFRESLEDSGIAVGQETEVTHARR